MDEEKLKTIFIEKINKYNGEKAFYEHFVQISKDILMVITWRQSWSYATYELEQSPPPEDTDP